MPRVSTGDLILDEALNGGFPQQSAVLLTGGPGTGKTTAAMQFLQTGLDNDEDCLFLSTEQSARDIRRTLAPYSFRLDDSNLTIATIHAGQGKSVQSGQEELVLRTLDGDTSIDEGHSLRFSGEAITQYVSHFGPQDRVVLDSASGLAALSNQQAVYRRLVLELIRLFKNEFDATSLLTAQEYSDQDDAGSNPGTLASSSTLEFTTDGVIRVWQENLHGEFHRFIHVTKMRGVDHDTRPFEMTLAGEKLRVRPNRRSPALELSTRTRHPTGLAGLDSLLGNGFIEGGSVVYKHDGESHADILLLKSMFEMLRQGEQVIYLPSSGLAYDQLDLLAKKIAETSLEIFLEEQGLIIFDFLSRGRSNRAFVPDDKTLDSVIALDDSTEIRNEIQRQHFRSEERITTCLAVDSLLQRVDVEYLRRMHSVLNADIRSEPHTLIYQLNPDLIDSLLDEFFTESSDQVLRQYRRHDGMEYVRLQKSMGGNVGSSRIVEYHDERPFVELAI